MKVFPFFGVERLVYMALGRSGRLQSICSRFGFFCARRCLLLDDAVVYKYRPEFEVRCACVRTSDITAVMLVSTYTHESKPVSVGEDILLKLKITNEYPVSVAVRIKLHGCLAVLCSGLSGEMREKVRAGKFPSS